MAVAGIRRLHPGGTSRAAALIMLLLAACTPHWPAVPGAEPGPEIGEAGESPDGSADGAADPAGLAEILADVLAGDLAGGQADGRYDDWYAGRSDGDVEPAAGLEAELRAQFGSLFIAEDAPLPEFALEEVARFVGLFHEGRARDNYRRWLAREGRYRDLILTELRAAGLPEELLYLAMLESGFDPLAVSRAKAVGLWQFMRVTGRESGLRIDDWVDERRDPVAATRAAIAHLRVLHRELGDWGLAAAAYNAGLGRVRRARDRTAPRAGYFELVAAGALPAETRSYVPLILAAGHVARHRERYGLGDIGSEPALVFDTVRVEGRTRLSAIATTAAVPLDQLRALNAHLLRGAAPPAGAGYVIRLPAGTDAAELPARLATLAVDERLLPEYRETTWVVRSGDSWWRIARAHGTTVNALRALNPRTGDMLHPGMRLVVARRAVFDDVPRPVADGAPPAAPGEARDGAAATHRVGRGETLTGLARRFGVSLDELVRWNGMGEPRPLREGEVLVVSAPAAEREG